MYSNKLLISILKYYKYIYSYKYTQFDAIRCNSTQFDMNSTHFNSKFDNIISYCQFASNLRRIASNCIEFDLFNVCL